MKRLAGLLWLLPLVLLVWVVVWLRGAESARSGSPDLPRVSAAEGFPREVTIPGGEVLVLPAPPQRILPVNAGAVDMVSALVGPERIAAIPEQALRYSRLVDDPGAFAAVPRFARYHAEAVLAHEPDLVVCDPWGATDTTARLHEAGVPVLLVPEVTHFDDVRRVLLLLGEVLGVEQQSRSLVADLDRRVAALRASTGPHVGLRAISYSNYGAKGSSAGGETTVNELIVLAGMHNLTAEMGRVGTVPISFEEILVLDPDVIVVSNLEGSDERGGTERFLAREPALANLRAVREGRIVGLLPRYFASTSQEILTAAELLARRVDALFREVDADARSESE